MITINDVKLRLNMDVTDTTEDAYILDEIERAKEFIRDYCNNENIDFDASVSLDNVLLFLVVREVNPETKFRAGKTSENNGLSFSYSDGLPKEYKSILKKYRRLTIL